MCWRSRDRLRRTQFKAEVYILTKEKAGGTAVLQGLSSQFYLRTTDVTGLRSCRRDGDGNAGDNVSLVID